MNQLWYSHTTKYYAAVRKNEEDSDCYSVDKWKDEKSETNEMSFLQGMSGKVVERLEMMGMRYWGWEGSTVLQLHVFV